jgi:hypothetical protein
MELVPPADIYCDRIDVDAGSADGLLHPGAAGDESGPAGCAEVRMTLGEVETLCMPDARSPTSMLQRALRLNGPPDRSSKPSRKTGAPRYLFRNRDQIYGAEFRFCQFPTIIRISLLCIFLMAKA